jgi:hypothetical protein
MLILRISRKKKQFLCRVLWSSDLTIMMLMVEALARHGGWGA